MVNFLIVDDSSFVRTTLREMLESEGHTIVAEAENGYKAIEMYKKYKPDIMTLDILMPLCSGMQALKDIIKIDPDAKIIMCTDIGQQTAVMAAIQAGAKNFIVKPVDKAKLINIVNNLASINKKSPKEQKKEKEKFINEENLVKQLSLDSIFLKDSEHTNSYMLQDDSLRDSGYFENDILIFETKITPEEGDIIIAVVNHKFIIGFYYNINGQKCIIQPAKSGCKPITDDNISIHGVVTGSVRRLKR